ncbi:polysaccharide pyruvyl transferase family protein [Nostoc sp. CCY 9925]|uniref:polysaccharide pyruvyl transferase family protein n=1 Tax=Nostoc sp. CCY 9925 TaxID=3103865 RepID=UPI0039C75571
MCLKIGIITYHFTINYGATLQAYALSRFLENNGYDVEIIDYRSKSIRLEQRKYLYPKRSWFNPNLLLKSRKKVVNMNNFLDKNLKISPKKFYEKNTLNEYKHLYDVVICGSDEIWNVNSPRGLDTPYFLDFLNGKDTRKVSYAPSFGSTTNLGLNKEKIHNLLKDFYSVSVRDNNSLSLINQGGFDFHIKKVVDPTFLIDYEDIIKVSDVESKYILVYGLLDQKEAEYVKALAEKEGLDIIAIGAPQIHLKPFLKLDLFDIAPDDWLGYFYNASFVVTNFFHGLVFAIIFNKPFIIFSHPQKTVKVRDILTPLGLESRLLNLNEINNKKTFLTDDDLLSPLLTEQQRNDLNQQIQISKDYLLREALK